MEIKLTDCLIIAATILGPILAVQAQKWLERDREIKNQRLRVFKTLMATRAINISHAHVEAINAVPIEFYGSSSELREINSKWKVYFEHLSKPVAVTPNWEEKRQELLYELLLLMSKYLGYDFDEVEIKKVYAPQGHAALESDQEIIRRGLVGLFKGDIAIPVSIVEAPNVEQSSAQVKND
jgi:hypothetical protein